MRKSKLKILPTGDKNSAFNSLTAKKIIERYGLPSYLLGSSAKLDKCESVHVLARVLYLTPGIFCPFASGACLAVCNGHTSGRMRLQDQTRARDKRASLYIEEQDYFIARLKSELYLLVADAMRHRLQPAARLNGSSDILWEVRHPELFDEFRGIQFYDYTKSANRVRQSLTAGSPWPDNYHLTFSVDADTRNVPAEAKRILNLGGTVTVPFSSELPETWWGFPLIDGDLHDARFLDPIGHVVGLRAKGLAKTADNGFTFDTSEAVAA